ncbi:MAG: phasin family protein [Alphaproteobacteria bacterium]
MSNSNNPFMDAFKVFTDNNMFSQNKSMLHAMDMNNLVSIQNRNAETMTAANQMIAENMQAIMRRQAEMMQNNATNMFQLVKEVATSTNPEANTNKNSNFAKNTFDNAVSNTKELMEMAMKSNMEMFNFITDKMSENMSECCDQARTTASTVVNAAKKKTA